MNTRPPETFGTEWRCVGEHRRYGRTLLLWVAVQPTQTFRDAYSRARGLMVGAGYSWTERGHGEPQMLPCWWSTGITFDVAALQAEVDRVVAEAAAEREEKARQEQERHGRDVAETELRAPPIRAELARLLADRPWLFVRHLAEARDLLAMEAWTSWGLKSAERLVSNALANVGRAEQRLNRPAPALWFARAADPAVQAAALAACRFLSSLDTDWAAIRNASGWSQATCWTGHLLSERKSLDQGETAHALALLHGHKLQLSDDLNLALFGAVPARRRRHAPEEASAFLL
ncbi:hypothetical protein B2G69_07295 [Methylorubrum zatmanii]|nr:hypothetical protein [Methylorubrum zatmanii]ARO53974.1 hypothetical protein B2G69_07295 [Methylorubrum zatmanii]